jgi:hypothetical protein
MVSGEKMNANGTKMFVAVWMVLLSGSAEGQSGEEDWRNIRTGCEIPSEGYCDQPYVVVTEEGNWLCTMTTGAGLEGEGGQHVVSTLSKDRGRTWSPHVDIEPADGPAASWAMPLAVPGGRVYVFYSYNGDNISKLGDRENIRSDTLGWYCYRYSDDEGRTWSRRRFRLPIRMTEVDRGNDWQGEVHLFWGIGKPIVFDGKAILGFTKIGKYMLDRSEGWFFRSDNILEEKDPEKIEWEMLPDGDRGLRNPDFGSIQSEQNLVPLSDGGLYCMYRTTTGYPCHAYSRDGGHTWTLPEQATYTPGGRRMKTPRACPRIWRAKNGKCLFWFHNHSGKDFFGRNPAWVSGGIEVDGRIHWSQPEILLYDPITGPSRENSPQAVRISYPDLIEQEGGYWITETQKSIARVHKIDQSLLEGVWSQGELKTVAQEGLVLSASAEGARKVADLPALPALNEGGGFSMDLWIEHSEAEAEAEAEGILLDGRDNTGKGVCVKTLETGTVQIDLSDGETETSWACDSGLLEPGALHHVVMTVDGGPGIITFVVDGVLCDGGEERQYGWGRIPWNLGNVNGSGQAVLSPEVMNLRVYNRSLRTSEAVANFLAGMQVE